MSELPTLLVEVADRARLYDIVDQAYAVGRRRRRIRHALTGGTVFAAVATTIVAVTLAANAPDRVDPAVTAEPTQSVEPTPTRATLPTSCTVQALPLPAGPSEMSFVTGGDPSGRFMVGRNYPGGAARRVLIWDHGSVSTVDMAGSDGQLYDVNSSGVAVGYSFIGEEMAAWVYQSGTTTRLAGGAAQALALNEQGVIVGSQTRSDPLGSVPVVWRSPTSAPELLPMPAGVDFGSAEGIDEDGSIVGTMNLGSRGLVVWRPGGTVLSLSPSQVTVRGHPGTVLVAIAIRAGRVLMFAAADEPGGARWLGRALWDTGTGEVRALEDVYEASAVNARGWIAAGLAIGNLMSPAIATADESVMLPTLSEGGGEVRAISDDGAILAGSSSDANGSGVAVMWRCQPPAAGP